MGGEYGDIILRDDAQRHMPLPTRRPTARRASLSDLTDLIDQYAPNIKAMMDANPDVKAAMTSMDGKIYGLPYVFHTATVQGHAGFFSEEWMKTLALIKCLRPP